MLLNIWSRQLNAGMAEEAIRFFKEISLQFRKNTGDIIKQTVGIDPAGNSLVMVTVWEDEQAYRKFVETGEFNEMVSSAERFYSTPLEVHDYQVVYDF